MTQVFIKAIRIYQLIFSTVLKNLLGVPKICRFDVTCSDYAIESIKSHGLFKGFLMFFQRLLKCQPFYKGGLV